MREHEVGVGSGGPEGEGRWGYGMKREGGGVKREVNVVTNRGATGGWER